MLNLALETTTSLVPPTANSKNILHLKKQESIQAAIDRLLPLKSDAGWSRCCCLIVLTCRRPKPSSRHLSACSPSLGIGVLEHRSSPCSHIRQLAFRLIAVAVTTRSRPYAHRGTSRSLGTMKSNGPSSRLPFACQANGDGDGASQAHILQQHSDSFSQFCTSGRRYHPSRRASTTDIRCIITRPDCGDHQIRTRPFKLQRNVLSNSGSPIWRLGRQAS